MNNFGRVLSHRLEERSAHVAVLGLGHAGFPMAVALAKAGYQVTGLDVDPLKVRMINEGSSPVSDARPGDIEALVENQHLRASQDFDILNEVDCALICVPTPLACDSRPNIEFVDSAARAIGARLHQGMLVVLQSTGAPGTTRRVLLPTLEATGLKVGYDFFLVFASERIDPGNRRFTVENVPKVVGGITPRCGQLAARLFAPVAERIVTVSSPEAAEMSKLVENTFRYLNISLVNAVAMLCDEMGIDVWEVVDAAATKPFAFMPHYPGPGVGGACIPVVPHFLKAAASGDSLVGELVDLADKINERMPRFVIGKLARLIAERGSALAQTRVLVLGVAYKANLNDARRSPAVPILALLRDAGADVTYYDPLIPSIDCAGVKMASLGEQRLLAERFDCAVLVTPHDNVPYAEIARNASFVLDTRNVLAPVEGATIVRL